MATPITGSNRETSGNGIRPALDSSISMSASGHKQTCAVQLGMSALRQKRTQSYLLGRCIVAESTLLLAFMMRRSPSHVLIWLAARQFS